MTPQQIRLKLREFNIKGYSDENAKYIDNGKGGKVISLTDGYLKYEDEYYGGEPYCGNETIWLNGKPIWRCVYYGFVESGEDFEKIYAFSRLALREGPSPTGVHRGPEIFIKDELTYQSQTKGTIENFVLEEKISRRGMQIYQATFMGGMVDQ